MAGKINTSGNVPVFTIKVDSSAGQSVSDLAAIDSAISNLGASLSAITGNNVTTENSSGQSVQQFTVNEANGAVTFGGVKTGDISVTIKADGSASFSRGSVNSENSVLDLSAVDIDVPSSAELDISLDGNSLQNNFEVNAQNATVINLSGSVAGSDEVTVRINDANASALNTTNLTVNTAGL
jgi:hypothetical protein